MAVEGGTACTGNLTPTPLTYETNGKQYLVIAARGHSKLLEMTLSDPLMAFALP